MELSNIINDIQIIEGIKNVHHVYIWNLKDHVIHFEAHIDLKKKQQLKKQFL